MPIYEYHCDACDTDFEEWHRHADDLTEVPCPGCKKTAHRVISNTSFVLKGGGWYVTEYGNRKTDSSGKAGAETASGAPAAETKTEPATPAAEPAPAPAPAKETAVAAAS